MKSVYEVDVYVHIRAEIEAESDSEHDIAEALFPNGWEGELQGISTDPNFSTIGYIEKVCDVEEDE